MSYLDDVVVKMRQGLAIIGNSNYAIPVYCVLLYTQSDIESLQFSGDINDNFSAQNMAEQYFSGIISDLGAIFGDKINSFNFIVKSGVSFGQSSSIVITVDIYGTAYKKKQDLFKSTKSTAYHYTQQDYLNDMSTRSAKTWLKK